MADIPPPPPGFTLDAAPASGDIPPPPPGFTLDTAGPSPTPDTGPIANFVNDTGRAAGLAYRGIVTGAAALPQEALDAANSVNALDPHSAISRAFTTGVLRQPDPGADPAAPATPYKPQLSDFVHPDKWQQAAEYFADKAGLPKPTTAADQVLYKAAQAAPSALITPEALVPGAVSAAAGGAASQVAANNGVGPVGQTIAGLAAGSVPALASGAAQGARGLLRDSAEATQARIANAAASGTQLTAGQAAGSGVLQKAEAASGALWGGGPIDKAATAQTQNLGSHVDAIVNNLAPGADISPMGAGAAINTGVAVAKQGMKAAESAAYGRVDTLVPPATPIDLSGTLAKLDTLASPTPGAEATTGALISPKIAAMRDNLQADIAANPANTPGGAATIPYNAARQLRTALGNSIDWGFAPADPVTNGGLKQIYGTLSDDLKAGASQVSPEAAQAASNANSLYAANSAKRELLNTIVDKAGGPEAVYQAATNGTKQGATRIRGVMSAIDTDNQNIVRATVLDRLGRALPGQQNAAGDAFNASTFLTNWAKLDPTAKDALFGASGPSNNLRSGLDSFTNTLLTLKESGALKNPSGTGKLLGHAIGASNAMSDIMIGLFTGHPAALAGMALPMVNNMAARALTNPRTVRWLAQSAKLPTSALPNAVNQLAQMGQAANDPDARDLATYLSAASQ